MKTRTVSLKREGLTTFIHKLMMPNNMSFFQRESKLETRKPKKTCISMLASKSTLNKSKKNKPASKQKRNLGEIISSLIPESKKLPSVKKK